MAALFVGGRELRGVEFARIEFEVAQDVARWWTEVPGKVKVWAKALTGPMSLPGKPLQMMNAPGCETGPGAQLVTCGKASVCRVEAFGYQWEWIGNSSKHIPFDWTGP